MIQQLNLNIQCQKDDHLGEIETVCYNYLCKEFRLNCFKCMKKGRIHHDHFYDVEKIKSLNEFIDIKNQECDDLIDDLNKFVENMNHSFSQLKKGIKQKYQLNKEILVHLNSQQINDFLNSTIKFNKYQQSITKIISQDTKKITYSLKHLYEQLKLYFISYLILKYFLKQTYHHLIIIRLMIILNNYPQTYMIEVLNQINNSIDCLLYIGKINMSMPQKYQINQYSKIQIIMNLYGVKVKQYIINRCIFINILLIILYISFLNKNEDAITWLDKAIAIDPKDAFSLSDKGECLQNYDQLDQKQDY